MVPITIVFMGFINHLTSLEGPHIVDDFPMNKQPLSELVSRLQNLEAQIHGVLEAPRITSQIRLCLQIRPSEINRNHIISHYKWWFSIVMLVYQRVIFNISMVFTAILWDLSPLSSKKHQKITRNPSQSPIFDGQIEKNPSNKSPQISEDLRSSQDFPGFPKSRIIQQLTPSPHPIIIPPFSACCAKIFRRRWSSLTMVVNEAYFTVMP